MYDITDLAMKHIKRFFGDMVYVLRFTAVADFSLWTAWEMYACCVLVCSSLTLNYHILREAMPAIVDPDMLHL